MPLKTANKNSQAAQYLGSQAVANPRTVYLATNKTSVFEDFEML